MPVRTLTLALLLAGISAVAPVIARAANCTLSSRAVAFDNYIPLNGAALNRTARILVATCNGSGILTVALGTGQSNSYAPRSMLSATTRDQLDYNLYTGAARTAIRGGDSVTVTQAFNSNRVRLSVYGRIPAMEDIAPGNDTDHIAATVTF